jgi:hypothetical protein
MFDCEKAGIRNLDMEITQFIVQVKLGNNSYTKLIKMEVFYSVSAVSNTILCNS